MIERLASVVVVRSSVLLAKADLQQTITDLVAEMAEFEPLTRKLGRGICWAISCVARSSHNQLITEMNALLRDMENTKNAGLCDTVVRLMFNVVWRSWIVCFYEDNNGRIRIFGGCRYWPNGSR